MPKRFDQTLAALQQAVDEPEAPGARARIVKALGSTNGMLVAVATSVAVRGDEDDPQVDRGLLERLVPAFERLQTDPVKRDPQCRGKVAIAKALRRAEEYPDEVFLVGVRYRQYEPVWGGRVDSAAELRGVCAMALMEEHHPRAVVEVAHLLADPESAARTAAARALGASGRTEVAEPLLRLRIEAGEAESDVVGECFGALLAVSPRESLPYVGAYLDSRDEGTADAAALALGESRLDGSLELLCARAERTLRDERRAILLLAIAMLRSDPAWGWLAEQVQQAPRPFAVAALRALATFKHDSRLHARVSEAVACRSRDPLESEFEEIFA